MANPRFERDTLCARRVVVSDCLPTSRADKPFFLFVNFRDVWIVVDIKTSVLEGAPVFLEYDDLHANKLIFALDSSVKMKIMLVIAEHFPKQVEEMR